MRICYILLCLAILLIPTFEAEAASIKYSELKDLKELKIAGFQQQTPKVHCRTLHHYLKIDLSSVKVHQTEAGVIFATKDRTFTLKPGYPQLPVKTLKFKLPKDAKVIDVKVAKGRYVKLLGKYKIAPAPEPLQWSKFNKKCGDKNETCLRKPNKKVYSSKSLYPGKLLDYYVGSDGKNTIVIVKFYPFQYIPADGGIIAILDAEINVYYDTTETFASKPRIQAGIVKVNGDWKYVPFPQEFDETPVIVAQIISEVSGDNCHVDIRNPSPSGFEIRIEDDPSVSDPSHPEYETVAWIALLPGEYKIGTKKIIAGKVSTNHNWIFVPFSFNTTPIVVATIDTENGLDPAIVDVRNVTTNGFEVRVEECLAYDGWHTYETIGYIAMEPGEYFVDGRRIVAMKVSTNHNWATFNYPREFTYTPILVAEIMSENGLDPAHADVKDVNNVSFTVRVEEDELKDGWHVYEDIGVIAMSYELDNIIITSEEFLAPATKLAEFHTNEGTLTEVFTTEWIYSSYDEAQDPPVEGYKNSSLPGWENIVGYNYSLALKTINMLRYASPKLKYVTLLGDASVVPPSYYVYIDVYYDYDNWIPTDFYYASPDYDIILNYAVGRLPARNIDEAWHMVQKTINWSSYLSWDWFSKVSLFGGRPFGTWYYIGELTIQDVINNDYLNGMSIQKFYTSDWNFTRSRVIGQLASDAGFLYIVTHGSGDSILTENDWSFVSVSDLMSLPANTETPIVVSVACRNGAWDTGLWNIGFETSFGEAVLLSNASGIAYFGSSRVAWACPDIQLEPNGYVSYFRDHCMCGLLNDIFKAYHFGATSIGNLGKMALDYYIYEEDIGSKYAQVTMFEFIVLGDPALRLLEPREGASYSQPYTPAVNYDGVNFYLMPYFEVVNTTRPVEISVQTDAPSVKVKRIDLRYNNVESGDVITVPSTYTFTTTNQTMWLIRFEEPYGKEGWTYVTTVYPLGGANVLYVLDEYEVDTPWELVDHYYTDALKAVGISYDVWDMELRGYLPSEILSNYSVVIWSTPFWGYLWWSDPNSYYYQPQYAELESYLSSGGSLFISGQDIAWALEYTEFLSDYLHVKLVGEEWIDTFVVSGVTGDPISDGLILGVGGGDGADNQWHPDIVEPADPYATPIFYYNFSGIAGVRVVTPQYRVVFLPFGYEAINNSADRTELMDRILTWLGVEKSSEIFRFGRLNTNHLWHTYEFSTPFSSVPIILATIQTENGLDPCLPDLRNPSQTGFEARVEEDLLCDGVHVYETIGFIFVNESYKAGLYAAGKFSVNHNWKHIEFPFTFDSTPVIVATIQTENGGDPCHVDLSNPSPSGFDIRIEEDELCDGWHVYETVGYLAIKEGVHYIGNVKIVAGKVSANHEWTQVTFPEPFNETPVVIATIMTENGIDNCHVDVKDVTTTGFRVRVEEDLAKDGWHVYETIGYVAISKS